MKTLITLFGILVFSISAAAQDGKVYEYLTMVKSDVDLHISVGSSGYEKVNIKSETVDKRYDMSAVNNRISLFEAEGWEFVSADHAYIPAAGGIVTYNVIMRRPKE